MSANATPSLPTTGDSLPEQAYTEQGPWGFNHLAHLVMHATNACPDCASWAHHYMLHVLRRDPSLALAETQRTDTIHAGLDTKIATLGGSNATLWAELSAACDDLASTRRTLDSADNEIFRLCDEVDDLWDKMDDVIHGLWDQVDDLQHQLRDLECGQSTRH